MSFRSRDGFIESAPTPAVRTRGLELGGHEQAALSWLQSTNGDQALKGNLLGKLWDFPCQQGAASPSTSTSTTGPTWTGTRSSKKFFVSKRFGGRLFLMTRIDMSKTTPTSTSTRKRDITACFLHNAAMGRRHRRGKRGRCVPWPWNKEGLKPFTLFFMLFSE